LGVKINSFKDLVTDKLQAFFGRMEPRDANEFPDDIRRWPVEMILDVDVTDLKRFFSELSTKVMEKIRASKK
jgi:hypothetical protein